MFDRTQKNSALEGSTSVTRELEWEGKDYSYRAITPPRSDHTSTLLILGGIMRPLHSWPRLEASLAGTTRLVFVELPGVSGKRTAVSPFTWEFLLGATVNVLDSLGIQHCNLMAASACGPLGYRLAQKHSRRISRLILVGAPSRVVTKETEDLIHHMDRFTALMPTLSTDRATRKEFACIIADALTLSNQSARRRSTMLVALALRHKLSTIPREEFEKYVQYHQDLMLGRDKEIIPPGGIEGVPTLAVYGEHDGITPPQSGHELAVEITDCTVAVMKDAGHMLHNERSKEFADLLTRFTSDVSLVGLPYCTVFPPRSEP